MLDLSATTTQRLFQSSEVDTLDDAELDTLDFGVIAVDADGIILRYNLYEARLARLDRNQVLGRSFFHDVAPCTRGEAFEGRFRQLVSAGDHAPPQQFEYLFDFKFGAQKVQVEIVSIAGEARYYLLINRSAVLPARPDLPQGGYAVLQQELAPDEIKLGVRRDTLEQRHVQVPWSLLAALRATCNRLAPDSWQIFCSEWGVQWGRRAALDLESSALESRGTALRELTMREVAELLSEHFARQGWGRARFDFGAAREGVIVVEIERSALAESAPQSRLAVGASADLACHLLAGCLGGVLTQVAARRLAVREVSCLAGGAGHCSFVVVADPRRAALEATLGKGVRGVEQVRAALRSAPATPGER
jgi:photoactive yellow protein